MHAIGEIGIFFQRYGVAVRYKFPLVHVSIFKTGRQVEAKHLVYIKSLVFFADRAVPPQEKKKRGGRQDNKPYALEHVLERVGSRVVCCHSFKAFPAPKW